MAISSSATGLRPGVCTSTTRPTAPYTGQIIYETDTGYLRVWNGSAWDYFTQKQSIVPGIWTTWSPTVTASSGTFTTVTVTSARYTRLQNVVFGSIDMTITSIGTASGVVFFSLPVTPSSLIYGCAVGSFRETAVSGYTGIVSVDSTGLGSFRKYDNASYIAASNRYEGTFTYEAA